MKLRLGFTRGDVDGSYRRKVPWIEEASGVGALLVEVILALSHKPGAAGGEGERDRGCQWPRVLGSCADLQSRCESHSGKPKTLRGRTGMVAAFDASPNASLLDARDAACG